MNNFSQNNVFGPNNMNIGYLGIEGYPGDTITEQLKNYLDNIDLQIVRFLLQGHTIPVWLNQLHANDLLQINQKLISEDILRITPTGNSQMSGSGTAVQYSFQPLQNFN
jgi:hypothetical protein